MLARDLSFSVPTISIHELLHNFTEQEALAKLGNVANQPFKAFDMELKGSVTIAASPEKVWQALNDPEILRRCIPGCEDIQQISPEEMHARVQLRMGPVRARFAGKVKMTDIRILQGYTLNFEGSGGSAGFARGSSVINLTPVADGTQLDYTTEASVAGKLGQIGGRLMDASARQLADKFFASFKSLLTTDNAEVALDAASPGAQRSVPTFGSTTTGNSSGGEMPRLLWLIAGVIVGVSATSIGVWMGSHWLR